MRFKRYAKKIKLGKAAVQAAIISSIIGAILASTGGGRRVEEPESPVMRVIVSPADDAAVKRAVRESQIIEATRIYADPESFDPGLLSVHWVAPELGGRATENIEASVARLMTRGWRYGHESRPEIFEFRRVALFGAGDEPDYAEVHTREKWFLPVYDKSGDLIANRNMFLGPFQIDYTLQRINDRWLVQSTSTPYAR
ncbi:MAG TPA: hypothetical protein VMV10_18115 [Pirellulales bacterium]|nr:hypothetical protein [Pirellulales bacterium]